MSRILNRQINLSHFRSVIIQVYYIALHKPKQKKATFRVKLYQIDINYTVDNIDESSDNGAT